MFKRLATLFGSASLPLVLLPGLVLSARQEPTSTPTTSQDTPKREASAKSDDPIARIREEGLERSQVMKTLSYLSDVIGPRLTNSPGMKRANEWTAQTLTEYGLVNAHIEPWGEFGRGWSLLRYSAQVISPQCIPLIGHPKAWSPGTNGTVTGPVVYLDAQDEKGLEAFKGKLQGAIVLVGSVRELKAWFEPPGIRFTDKQLLDLANAPEASNRRAFAAQAGSPAEKKDDARKGEGRRSPFETPRKEEAKKEAQPDTDEAQRAALIARMRSQGSFTSRRLQFLIDEGAAVMMEPSFRGDGGTVFVSSASVPQPPAPDRGGGDGRPQPAVARSRVSAWSKDAPKTIPQIVLAIEHFNRLVRMIQAGETVTASVELATQFHDDDLQGYNTLAEIPGTDPELKDQIVMLGGHMDSWHGGTGATDNASGCAVAMEAVRILKALDLKPRRTIRIALWSGEEQGLYGSRGYVAKHFASFGEGEAAQRAGMMSMMGVGGPRPPLVKREEYDRFSVYFNYDNGTGKIRGVYLQGNEAARPIFRRWLMPFRDLDAATLTSSNTSGTDHLSFDTVGLPGFQFIQDPIEYEPRTHHSNMDVFDRIQADDMKQSATIMAAFIHNAAMMDERFPRKPDPQPASSEPTPRPAPVGAQAAEGATSR
jgi:hypothetical protein